MKALPKEFIFLTKNIVEHQPINPQFGIVAVQGISLTDKKCTNQFIRHCLTENLFPGKNNNNDIRSKYDKKSFEKLRTMYLKFPTQPKVKETHFKIMYSVYPAKELLRKCFNIDDNACTFCENGVETIDHVFFECNKTQTFWQKFQDWSNGTFGNPSPISRDTVTFGTLIENKNKELCYNLILCLAIFFIHKQRVLKSPPIFKIFLIDFGTYLKSLKCINRHEKIYDFLGKLPTNV